MRNEAKNGEEFKEEANTQRLEAFSDGVFAIAITLLILEIKIPHLAGASPNLARALLSLWPAYLTYILTFVSVGIYWANHHFIYRLYRATDHLFNLLNVLFLMCVAFMPLPAAALGEYVTNPATRRAAVVFYAVGLLLPALSWLFAWLYASHDYRLIDRRLTPEFVRRLTWQYVVSAGLYTLSLLAALAEPLLGLAIAAGLTLLYLLPPKNPVYREEA